MGMLCVFVETMKKAETSAHKISSKNFHAGNFLDFQFNVQEGMVTTRSTVTSESLKFRFKKSNRYVWSSLKSKFQQSF